MCLPNETSQCLLQGSETDIIPGIDTETASDSSGLELTKIPTRNTHTAFYGLEDISRALGNKFPDFSLNNLLLKTAYGKSILTYYDKNKCLDDTHRSRLVDMIVKHIYNYITQQ